MLGSRSTSAPINSSAKRSGAAASQRLLAQEPGSSVRRRTRWESRSARPRRLRESVSTQTLSRKRRGRADRDSHLVLRRTEDPGSWASRRWLAAAPDRFADELIGALVERDPSMPRDLHEPQLFELATHGAQSLDELDVRLRFPALREQPDRVGRVRV